MADLPSPTVTILERLPPVSTTGLTKDTVLKLVKIVDSYHDFKNSVRVKNAVSGTPDEKEAAIEAAKVFENPGAAGTPSPKQGSQFQTILNNLFNLEFANLTEDTFFKSNGIVKSSPENSGRLFFEKECGGILHATSVLGCVPTRATCSTFEPDSLTSDAMILELDAAFKQQDESNAAIGTKLLTWFFPDTPAGTNNGIGFNFDAQSAILKDFMQPLNDKGSLFYTSQIVTPQNILDSAGIGYYVLVDKSRKFEFFKLTEEGRTEYVLPGGSETEYSNLFTEGLGQFKINNTSFGGSEFNQDFSWTFTPTGGAPIAMNMAEGTRNTGPSVTFLASLIDCFLKYKNNDATLAACWKSKETNNDKMISPLPVIEDLLAANAEFIPRLLFDIKRLGDHEQANSVYYYNRQGGYKTIFVTGDILSALYSRLLGNPTIYIRTSGEDADDEDDVSSITSPYLMCYRGVELVTDPLKKAQKDAESALTQLNYFLFTISTFINLAEESDFDTLVNNLDYYKDATPFVGEHSHLKNILLKAKIYNSLEFLLDIRRNAASLRSSKNDLDTVIKVILNMAVPPLSYEGVNLTLNEGLTEDVLKSITTILTDGMKVIEPMLNNIVTYLQHFNKVKFQTLRGANTIFSFHNTLFFSANKLSDTLDTINYKKEHIDNIVVPISALGRGPRPQQFKLCKERLQQKCYEFLNGFFTTAGFEKKTMLSSLDEVIDSIKTSLDYGKINGLFNQIIDLTDVTNQTPAKAAVAHAAAAAMSMERSVSFARNEAAAAAADPAAVADLITTTPAVLAANALAVGETDTSSSSSDAAAALVSTAVKESWTSLHELAAVAAAPSAIPSADVVPGPSETDGATDNAVEGDADVAYAAPSAADAGLNAALVASTAKARSESQRSKRELARSRKKIVAVPRRRRRAGGSMPTAEQGGGSMPKEQGGGSMPKDQRPAQSGGEDISILMKDVFVKITQIIYKIYDTHPGAASMVPGNYIKNVQVYPHPFPYKEARKPTAFPVMRTGLFAPLHATDEYRPQLLAGKGGAQTRKQQKRRSRHTRKVGGEYLLTELGILSNYDSIHQSKLAFDYFKHLKEYADKLGTADDQVRRNKLRDKWYYFTAMLDTKGTPDLAKTAKSRFAYDIRMLKTYKDFTNNIDHYLSLEMPLGDTSRVLKVEGVRMYLDPEETLRIGVNNIIAYSEVKAKYEAELEEYKELNADTYAANIELCNYNIASIDEHIAVTTQLIQLVGMELPDPLVSKPAPPNSYEVEEPVAEEEQGGGSRPKEQGGGSRPKEQGGGSRPKEQGGGKRKRRTHKNKSRNRANNKSRRMQ